MDCQKGLVRTVWHSARKLFLSTCVIPSLLVSGKICTSSFPKSYSSQVKLRDALKRCILQRQNKLCPLFHNQRRKILMVYFHILYADTEVFTVTISSSNSLQISYSTAALKFTCATTEGIRFTKHQYQCTPFPSPFQFSDNLAIPTGGEVHG